jgi:hypothetical protein
LGRTTHDHGELVLDDTSLGEWCREWLGARAAGILFRSGHLAQVVGVRLTDDRSVVLKIRPSEPRIAGCVAVPGQAAFPRPARLGNAE